MTQEDLIDYIVSNLSLDIKTDLQGNPHICLRFGGNLISSVILPDYGGIQPFPANNG
jgi:hypothetical protein